MNTRDIAVFQAVAETKSITESSKKLYLSPQGVSKIIKNLETEFNCVLFHRTPTGLILTQCGETVADHLEEINRELRGMKLDIDRIRQAESNSIDLLSAYGIIRLLTPDCLLQFQKQNPHIQFSYREYQDMHVERYYKNGEGNIAFSIGDCDKESFDVTELESFPIKLLVHRENPLSQKESVTIEDLRNQPLYIEGSAFKIHHIIVDRCRAAGFEPDIIFEASGFSLCKKMVAENKGISVITDFVFEDMREAGLKLIPFEDGDYNWTVCMLSRKDEEDSLAVKLFKEYVGQWISLIKDGTIKR